MNRWIRHTHPDGFRVGQWAKIINTKLVLVNGIHRPCFEVQFPDGVQDLWAIHDANEAYEYESSDDVPQEPAEHNVCDFDCDNCHNGGGNPACDRGGCPEDNVTQAAEDAAWLDRLREGHAGLGCPICLTSVCRFLGDD